MPRVIYLWHSEFHIWWTCQSWLVFTARLMIFFVTLQIISTQEYTCQNETDCGFQQLAYHRDSGQDRIYIGGRNRLIQLSLDTGNTFTERRKVNTGPAEEFISCKPSCGGEKKKTNNFNKVLIVNKNSSSIIVCGSVFQGTCEQRKLLDIRDILENRVTDLKFISLVTPNSENDSTVAFLIPNPQNQDQQAMVVGVTYSNDDYVDTSAVLSLSTRQVMLNSKFKPVYTEDISDSSSSFAKTKPSFRIFYRAGFVHGNYSYMLTNQKFTYISSDYVSKILRVCNQINPNVHGYNYKSMMDMEITCQAEDGSQTYKLLTAANVVDAGGRKLLVAGFTDGDDPENLNSFNSSAVCVYKLEDIESQFQRNLDDCLRGNASSTDDELYWSNIPGQCSVPNTNRIGKSSCEIGDIVRGVLGRRDMSAQNGLVLGAGSYVTAVQTTSWDDYSVLFLGTSSGHIVKGCLKSASSREIKIYENVTVEEGNSIKSDLLLDFNQTNIFVLTANKVIRLPVQNCSQYTECSGCLKSGDPYCGWCVLEQKCNIKTDCLNGDTSNYWLSAVDQTKRCLTMSIEPAYVNIQEVEKVAELNLTVDPLPNLGETPDSPVEKQHLQVVFSGLDSTVTCNVTPSQGGNTLICPLPRITSIPGPSKTSTLSLQLTSRNITIVRRRFYFVDCTKITDSCSACVKHFSCVWCIYGNRCSYNHTLCPEENHYVSTKKYQPDSSTKCPTLTSNGNLAIPNNSHRKVTLLGQHFPQPKSNLGYECEVMITGNGPVRLNATWVNSTSVDCSSYTFAYASIEGEKSGSIHLRWVNTSRSSDSKVDNEQEVTVYKCKVLGDDCSTCGSYTKEFRPGKDYKCQWCDQSCRYTTDQCAQPCPPPIIGKVSPSSTHIYGGTSVTIDGDELGRGPADVTNITLAGYECRQITPAFEVSHKIVCKTKPVEAQHGPVKVTVLNKSSNSEIFFTFGKPKFKDLTPRKGPIDGGTLITISGTNLDIGLHRSFTFQNDNSESVPCQPEKMSPNEIICKVLGVLTPQQFRRFVANIDGKDFEFDNATYNFTLNPTLETMDPGTSFESGGRIIAITGTYFDSIQKPQFFLRRGPCECSKPEPCFHSEEDPFRMIECYSPPLPQGRWIRCPACNSSRRKRREAHDGIRVGFLMDDVGSVQDPSNKDFQLEFVTDPVYQNLTDEDKYEAGQQLLIKGENLTEAATKEDVTVLLCNSSCKVTRLTPTELSCTLPKNVAGCEKRLEENVLAVTVTVGYLEYPLGSLVTVVVKFPLEYIIALVVIIVVLIMLLVGLTLKYRQHKHKRQKDMERLQHEYELLERSVRQEARQEFADLQQDIKLVTSDVVRQGVPYKELAHYTYTMLFPGDIRGENTLLNHSQTVGLDENFNQSCLRLLDDLIGNKFFLLPCLRALEMEKKMSAKDKSNLANLLTVILLSKLDYMMQIWMELLKEHVSRAVERKLHKQIMRRNETIVEKMISNWLSLCMYNNMKDHTGSSLYMLYKATEMLTDYGPVDAVTGEAHYTLSEERLLKETVQSNQLSITVLVNGEEYQCKVLSCDTISQAKQKFLNHIYASAPVSERPRDDQVDLEWHWGTNGRLILDNFDNTTEADGDWRKINTLEHYNVKNESKMALLSKEDEGIETDSPYSNMNRSSANLISSDDVDVHVDGRIWHLVKKEDDKEDTKQRVITEIYLTRLMSTKVPLLNFLNAFVDTVFTSSNVPKAVKFLFDYFDTLAQTNGIQDSEVSYIWKSNSLPIRYWGNLLKAPQLAFDVFKPDLSEPSLEVLAQCFIDSCSLTELKMGKDSPASKLLFSRDVPKYRQQVAAFYENVADIPTVSEQDVAVELSNLSMSLHRNNLFSRRAALFELSKILKLYEDQIIEGLEENTDAKKLQLGHKMEEFLEKMTKS